MPQDKIKVSVIGGSGFIGTYFCQRLNELKIDFEIIDLKISNEYPQKYKFGDVRDKNSLHCTIEGNVVLNLAAVHRDDIKDKNLYYDTNVLGAENIANVCTEKGIKKIIFTSSVAVYGFALPGIDESGEIKPFNEYGKTKFQAEEKLRAWNLESCNELIIVRPTVVFGEGNRGNVYNLLKQISSGYFVMIGDGKNKKSMAYVGNLVKFLICCLEAKHKYAVYNYVDTPDLDMNTLVKQVRNKLMRKNNIGIRLPFWVGLSIGRIADILSKIIVRPLPVSYIRVIKFCSDSSFLSAKNSLDGFEPEYSLQEGIDNTLQSEFLDKDKKREVFYSE